MIAINKARSKKSSLLEEVVLKLVTIFLGTFLSAIAINGFFIPNKLISGGVTGISIILHYIFDLPTGLLIIIINIPIFIIGARFIDKKFVFYSFITMMSMSFLLILTDGIQYYINIDDLILSAVFGGILNGIGMGILFRVRVSQGGLDIIAAIFKKKLNINLGTVLMGINTLIVGFSSLVFGLTPAMYTLIALYIGYTVLDKVQIGLDTSNSVIIITKNPEELPYKIHSMLGRGSTYIKGEGTFSKEDKKIIYCTVRTTQIGKLKEIVEKHDPDAFMTINNTSEVRGKGFRTIGF